jgi:hypothetical protein
MFIFWETANAYVLKYNYFRKITYYKWLILDKKVSLQQKTELLFFSEKYSSNTDNKCHSNWLEIHLILHLNNSGQKWIIFDRTFWHVKYVHNLRIKRNSRYL